MIVVTAPTGNIGRHVVDELLNAGKKVRIIIRDPAKLPAGVRDRVEVAQGSHGDPTVVDRAFEGADALFWLAPPNPRETLERSYLDFTRPAANAIRRHAVKRVVSITALGRNTAWQNNAGLVTASIKMDDILMETGVAFRGMAMPSFMDNALQQLQAIKVEGVMLGPIDADKKAPTTATCDMGEFAAQLLLDNSWVGQEEVPVLGPEDLSPTEIASIISSVLKIPVRYQQVSFGSFKKRLLDHGMSESFAQGYVDMMRAKNEGMDNFAERSTSHRAPTTFRHWCEAELTDGMNSKS